MERETEQDEQEPIEVRPATRSRQPKADRKVFVYRMMDGKPKEFGSFPEAVVGEPLERRLLPFLKEMNVEAGDYKIEVRKPNGHFERSYEFSIGETDQERRTVIDIEPEIEDDDEDEQPNYDISGEIELRAELIALRREMKESREREQERKEGVKESDTNALAMIREMQRQSEKSFQQGLQMAQMIMQSSQPKENPSELMLSMLKGTLEVQRGVRQLSEEIAPNEPSSGDGDSFLAGGAKMLDSIGRNAGTLLPLLTGLLPKPQPPIMPPSAQFISEPTTPPGELGDLAAKISRKKQTVTVEVANNGKAKKS